jgi:hypothetical protein
MAIYAGRYWPSKLSRTLPGSPNNLKGLKTVAEHSDKTAEGVHDRQSLLMQVQVYYSAEHRVRKHGARYQPSLKLSENGFRESQRVI